MDANSMPDELLPPQFELLSDLDKQGYYDIRARVRKIVESNRTKVQIEDFTKVLGIVNRYCVKNDDDDNLRMRVCGICWLTNLLAVNLTRFHYFLNVSKASLSLVLQKTGYNRVDMENQETPPILAAIPSLLSNYAELREWSYHECYVGTPQPSSILSNRGLLHAIPQSPKPEAPDACSGSKLQNSIPKLHSLDEIAAYFEDPFSCSPLFLVESVISVPSRPTSLPSATINS